MSVLLRHTDLSRLLQIIPELSTNIFAVHMPGKWYVIHAVNQ